MKPGLKVECCPNHSQLPLPRSSLPPRLQHQPPAQTQGDDALEGLGAQAGDFQEPSFMARMQLEAAWPTCASVGWWPESEL